ncbi:hypothetical protein [Saccharolobus caldissimus]|uniref:Uncharacterized protein n=1 Tax=Saccharolobus caldissimus TaxID=1702097 RepID=A0AAQ4CS97_9CREN|nr:hypothetical protein [Saccharolobus caldissimus]BDB98678.1 hypothetical protein SACC_16950 [Saccharolobus caldissimus]
MLRLRSSGLPVGVIKVMREKGFDRHTASAYLIALKGLEVIKNNE